MIWHQVYNPLGHTWLSTLVAALPLVVLLGAIGWLRIRTHLAALAGLGTALAVAIVVCGMPVKVAAAAAAHGAAFGLFPISWTIFNIIFFYHLTVKRGLFDILRDSLAHLAPDPRVQVILIAFSFGAFIEGVAGFGAPVAITGAILIQLGFQPLQACVLALIANTAPVAFGSVGLPVTTLAQVAGLDVMKLSAMVGRQLPVFSLIIPFWVVAAFGGWRAMLGIWPAALTAGIAFAVPQFLVSNHHGPWLVDTVSGACSILALVLLLRRWRPADGWTPVEKDPAGQGDALEHPSASVRPARRQVIQAWAPWSVVMLFILAWGLPSVKNSLDAVFAPKIAIPELHHLVQRVPPVAAADAAPEAAEFKFNFLSATGTSILFAAILSGIVMGFSVRDFGRVWLESLWRIRWSVLTIAAMLALGNVTKYSGTDAILGLSLAKSGAWYPFFGTLLGWLGVALTGSDTASNVLFGSLQRITAEQTGISPVLMCSANSSGGVMGKMVDAQSIVVASTATGFYGHEGAILRRVFWHSLILASLVGLLVFLQAKVPPFTQMVVP